MSNENILNTGEPAAGEGLHSKLQTGGKLKTLLALGPWALARRLWQQPTLRTTAVFALSGLAFALGNLLLARTMPVEAYGQLSLAIALFNVFGLLAPIGIDQVLLRHAIDPSPRLLAFLTVTGSVTGMLVGLGFSLYTGLSWAHAAALALAIASGGIVALLMALARSRHREWTSLLFATAASWVLLLIGISALALSIQTLLLPLSLFALGNMLAAGLGWFMVANTHRVEPSIKTAIPWGEAFSLLGIAAIGTVVLQMERLIIPPAIGISALALFSVLASVAIFPFRLLTASAGFSLVPKLRAATSLAEKHRLVKHELVSVSALLIIATFGIALLSPLATEILTGGRYQIDLTLALAACFNGYAKVLQSFPRALITACGDDQDIARLNRLGWIGLVASLAGAFAGAPWGLQGLLYGVAAGSLVGSLPAILLAERKLR